jgi:hypothetical protein
MGIEQQPGMQGIELLPLAGGFPVNL